jgi:putative ABC transport system permease protein
MALAIAVVLAILFQTVFNTLVSQQLSLAFLFHKGLGGYLISIGLIAVVLLGIFISGFYPAFVLSSFKPILVLKGKYSSSKKGIVLRKGLVIGQFTITIVLITGALIVYRQIKYMSSQKLGLNIDQVLVVSGPQFLAADTADTRAKAFLSEVKQIATVKDAATSFWVPGNETGRNFNIRAAHSDPNTHYTMRFNGVSTEYIKTYGMKLVAGRDFVPTDYAKRYEDLRNIIVNESAAKLLGFSSPEAAIGQIMINDQSKWTIIGVVEDFHQKSLRYAIEPTFFRPQLRIGAQISVKMNTSNPTATVATIKAAYDKFFPGNIFDYAFLDQRYNEQYKNDALFGQAFGIFGGFAIFIASLGLLGLSLFATLQRTKEIGVRKVLGASVSSIVLLLSKDFIKLVAVAIVIGSFVAWYLLHNWLQNFAYHIGISWWIFVLSGIVAILIALTTISFQAIKAAVANPVKSLRSE